MNQAQTCSTVPENVDNIINTVTGETPKKTKKAIESGDAPTPIRLRWKYCTGKPYLVEAFCSDKDGNRTSRRERHICCVCGAKTSWRCLECKEWFCMENPADTKNKKRRYSLVQSTVDNKLVEFQNACFHNKHREAWEVDK